MLMMVLSEYMKDIIILPQKKDILHVPSSSCYRHTGMISRILQAYALKNSETESSTGSH